MKCYEERHILIVFGYNISLHLRYEKVADALRIRPSLTKFHVDKNN